MQQKNKTHRKAIFTVFLAYSSPSNKTKSGLGKGVVVVDVKVTLLHQVRNWATVILGNIEMGNLEKALLATEHLKGNIRTVQSCEEAKQKICC